MYSYSEPQLLQGILAQLARGNILLEEVLQRQDRLEQRMQELEEGTGEQLRQQAVEIRSRIEDMLLRV